MPYWIKHETENLYWSEKDGWVQPDEDLMTEYSDAQQKKVTLPLFGAWEQRTHTLMYSLPFWLKGATNEWGKKVTGEQLRAAVMDRIEELDRKGWSSKEVFGPTSSNPEN